MDRDSNTAFQIRQMTKQYLNLSMLGPILMPMLTWQMIPYQDKREEFFSAIYYFLFHPPESQDI